MEHLRSVYMLFPGDAAKLVGVHRSTVNRWLNTGKMDGRKLRNGFWITDLESINNVRAGYLLSPLTEEDIDEYYETGKVPFTKIVD